MVPYAGLSNFEVVEKVLAGYQLSIPKDCPEEVYQVMRSCWNFKPEARPDFRRLHSEIGNLIIRSATHDTQTDQSNSLGGNINSDYSIVV